MSDFSTAWLDLREPADRQARDTKLLRDAAALIGGGDAVIVDLGCGTGSTLRALGPLLVSTARWRLVDRDPALLAAAKARTAQPVENFCLDLSQIEDLPLAGAALVTASALFDLCSADFIARLANALARRQIGIYAALTYDGHAAFDPPHPLDALVLKAFNSHQQSDKGFGVALGPDATDILSSVLQRLGYTVSCAQSDWRLGPDMQELQRAFVTGFVAPVAETGLVDGTALHAWQDWRLQAVAQGGTCQVGHVDLLALPPLTRSATP